MNKLLVHMEGAEEYKPQLEALCRGRLEPVYLPEELTREEFRQVAVGAEALLGSVPADWLGEAELRWVQLPMAGANRFTGESAVRKLILTNASGAFGVTIAEHCLGLLLAFARRLPAYIRQGDRGLWKDCGTEWGLVGRRALILGTGDLGTQLALRLKALGMEVIGICRTKAQPRPPYDRLLTIEHFAEYLPTVDAVFGCLPSTPATKGLLNGRALASMREDAILINVGRGDLIETDALVRLLEQGRFYGVGLDVTDPEPLPEDHPLWGFERVIITPHVAGIGFGHLGKTQSDVWSIALDNLGRYCRGEELKHVVDVDLGY